nr:C. briggsae CBR-DGK-5 protein [Haemonchus contortus]
MTMKTSSERRATFAREPARSVSVPPRKRWFRKASLGRVKSQEGVCDDVTRKLVGAITTWHDIQSSLLRLSIDRSDSSLLTDDSMESSSSEEPLHGM